MYRKITPIFREKKVFLRQTKRAVTPFGGLCVFFEFLRKVGYGQAVSEAMPFRLKSPNAIDPAQTFTAFLISVLAGARRFAHSSLLRADRALMNQVFDQFSEPGCRTLADLKRVLLFIGDRAK